VWLWDDIDFRNRDAWKQTSSFVLVYSDSFAHFDEKDLLCAGNAASVRSQTLSADMGNDA